MGVIYSGQTITNTVVSAATNDTLNQAVSNALVAAGWSLIKSGSSDGVWRVRSAATPQGMQGDVWMWRSTGSPAPSLFAASSPLATTNTSGLLEQVSQTLVVGTGFTYQLVANAYYFYLFRATNPMPAQGCFFFTVPYIPPNLVGLVNSIICAYGSAQTTDTIGATGMFTTAAGAFACLNGQGSTRASQFNFYSVATYSKPTWFDGSCEYYEPRVMAYQTSGGGAVSGTLHACGYQWDALVVNQPLPRGTTLTYDGGTWYVLTEGTDPALMIKVA
jgi:hypothetical protein